MKDIKQDISKDTSNANIKKKKLKKKTHFCENMVSEREVKSSYFLQVW
jgi:hypothetical protein